MKMFPRMLCALICLLLAGLAAVGVLDRLWMKAGGGALREKNAGYLEQTFDKALSGFGVMSGLKAGLAVVEGSTGGVSAGVSLNLQVGDVVQSAYDYVDIAWRTLLLGSISLLSLQYLLQVADLLAPFVLALFLALTAGELFFKRFTQPLGDLRMLSLFCALVLYLLLPLSVLAAAELSERITAPSVDAAQQGFAEAGDRLFPESGELEEGLVARIKQIPERLEQISDYLKTKTAEMSLWTVQLIAGYLFDCMLFPLGCFLGMLWGSRSLLRYCHSCRQQAALTREIRALGERK